MSLFLVFCIFLAGCAYKPSRQAFILPQKINQIALLVPLTGTYGASGQAIRNGFLAAYYANKSTDTHLPAVRIINTALGNIFSAYEDAIQGGASFIIGPLINANLQQLQHFSVPTVSLNWLPSGKVYQNLYQFGLSSIDEVGQVVRQMSQNGYQDALVIVPKNEWGFHLERAFVDQWHTLGKNVAGILEFTTPKRLSADIAALLKVNQSYGNSQQVQKAISEDVRFLPRRRQDFDAIFVAAGPNMARQIVPSLRFYYVQDIPIYAISSIYEGKTNSYRDQDINGVIFCDMPWMLLNKTQLPQPLASIDQQIERLWPKDAERYPRFYALGIDAFLIFQHFNELGLSAANTVQGATGLLYLTDDQRIRRILTFAVIQDGQPTLMDTF